ncbi:MAG: proteasome ATPase [Trueperella sp.]|nr:proteasome ATPase [Trueperella sp.]
MTTQPPTPRPEDLDKSFSLQGGDEFQQLRHQLISITEKNNRLAQSLEKSRTHIKELSRKLTELAEPPNTVGVFLAAQPDQRQVTALVNGRKMRLAVTSLVDLHKIEPGQELLLNGQLAVIGVGGYQRTGQIVTVKLVLDAHRALVEVHADDERVIYLAAKLGSVRVGDMLLADLATGFALEHVDRPDLAHLLLEETPNVSYADIGGLAAQIEQIRDSVELPFSRPELYREHGLKPPKGVLLYGPPGTGKTLIAKAIATELAKTTGKSSYFLNVKGPQLLNKYVGETERQIREIFARARDRANAGVPVVIFFDEMEALFRTRGSGLSSDVETTVVPQLLAEMDGVEQLDNVIVIGASNREDMIDPAVLRPGRLDIKIRIDRPDRAGALDILSKYLTPELPIHESELGERSAAEAVVAMAQTVVAELYGSATDTVAGDAPLGARFVSGALLAAVVDRAKKLAIKDYLATGERGITTRHLQAGLAAEIAEHSQLAAPTKEA